jgi:hypothetical protein
MNEHYGKILKMTEQNPNNNWWKSQNDWELYQMTKHCSKIVRMIEQNLKMTEQNLKNDWQKLQNDWENHKMIEYYSKMTDKKKIEHRSENELLRT